jgi:hypothetical protein
MGLVDKLLIGRKIAEIEVYLSQIEEYSKFSVKNYKEDWKTQTDLIISAMNCMTCDHMPAVVVF